MRRLGFALVATLMAWPGSAQQTLTRYTIDAGGGRSTGPRHVVTGSVGQHDARPLLEGGRYRLGAGFWTAVEPRIFGDGFEGD